MKTALERRLRRKLRIRKKVSGTADKPRISVFRSLKHVYAQAVNDDAGQPICGVHSKSLQKQGVKGTKLEIAKFVGQKLGEKLLEKGIKRAVFDRSGYKYHGRVCAVCEGLREAGIQV